MRTSQTVDRTGDEPKESGQQLSFGSAATLLTVATLAANAGNYLLNLLLGRWLTPAEFSDATLMVTLMLLITAVAMSLQLVAAKLLADPLESSEENGKAVTSWLSKLALVVGMTVTVALTVAAPALSRVFDTASVWPFVVLAVGMPFYLMQAVGRGAQQARFDFRALAMTFIVEMVVRVVVAVALVAAGLGVLGATIGLTASFIATWWMVRAQARPHRVASVGSATIQRARAIARPTGILLLGQIVANNGDVLIAKQNFAPALAGVYSAVALIGRAVFFISWSVATALFPAASDAAAGAIGSSPNRLLGRAALAISALGITAAIATRLVGNTLLGRVFGPEYEGQSSALSVYALATTMFALANLVATFHLARGRNRESVILLVGAVVQCALLMAMNDSITSLVRAQLIAMTALAAAIGVSHLTSLRSRHLLSSTLEPAT